VQIIVPLLFLAGDRASSLAVGWVDTRRQGDMLAKAVGAGEVSFLIADISGGALARLVRAQPGEAPGQERTDVPATVPIAGTPAGLALRSQQVQLAVTGDEVWLWAPVTERGEAVGVLELMLPTLPDEQTVAYLASAGRWSTSRTASSKAQRVRVEAFSKTSATFRPASAGPAQRSAGVPAVAAGAGRSRCNTVQLDLQRCSLSVCLALGGRSRSRIVACLSWCRSVS